MFSTAILVFREVLEAALIIGLVAVATREVVSRIKWISLGILGGILGAIAIAMLGDVINSAAAGLGQELLNAMILFAAVLMLGWHKRLDWPSVRVNNRCMQWRYWLGLLFYVKARKWCCSYIACSQAAHPLVRLVPVVLLVWR